MGQPRLVDIHGHLFNAGHVPISGVLQRFGVPAKIADALEEHIHRRLPELSGVDATEALPPFGDEDALLSWLAKGTDLSVLNTLDGIELTGIESIEDLIETASRAVDAARAFKEWLATMMLSESLIARRYTEVFGGDVLLVHHMMDMDNYYSGRPALYETPTMRLERLAGLTSDSGFQLKVFFAYDPLRANGVFLAKQAVEELGATGIKFYPPNGYSAVDNPNHQMDKSNLELFRWASAEGVPILTHCTRGGFESRSSLGRRSDPIHWRRVLESDGCADLRLCLGHAGGADEWCGSELGPYARTVVELCTRFDNVYCEFGHFDEVLDPTQAEALEHHLDLVALDLSNRPTKFGRRIMFGTDWHVSAALNREMGGYVEALRGVFSRRLQPLSDGFFFGNALEFLSEK